MDEKQVELNDINYQVYFKLKEIRAKFYGLLKFIIKNKDELKNMQNKNKFTDLIKLKEVLEPMEKYLEVFNNNKKNNIKINISDKFMNNSIINKIQENINHNNSIIEFEVLFVNALLELNNFQINYEQKSSSLTNIESPNNNGNSTNLLNFNEQEIKDYIKRKNYNMISFNLAKINNYIYYIFELNYFNIILIQKDKNIFSFNLIQVQTKYKSPDNNLLMKKIRDELSDIAKYIISVKKINLMNFIKYFINYIHDYDKIFNIECYKCKKISKYSSVEKAFFPPCIKYNFEKNYSIRYLYNDKDKDKLFFHPQCI